MIYPLLTFGQGNYLITNTVILYSSYIAQKHWDPGIVKQIPRLDPGGEMDRHPGIVSPNFDASKNYNIITF